MGLSCEKVGEAHGLVWGSKSRILVSLVFITKHHYLNSASKVSFSMFRLDLRQSLDSGLQ